MNSGPSTSSLKSIILQTDYLVLEDLTCSFDRPCIMDLKMGTRRHGDDQSEEKQRRHMERCASTTSARLGVSMAGVQVWRRHDVFQLHTIVKEQRERNAWRAPHLFLLASHGIISSWTYAQRQKTLHIIRVMGAWDMGV